MLIKSVPCKTFRCKSLIQYINKSKDKAPFAILHNLDAYKDNVKAVTREFVQNGKLIKTRSNTTYFFHEILSLSPSDRDAYPPDRMLTILEDLAYVYLEKRGNTALGYGKIEVGKNGNYHVHLIISGNHKATDRKLRLSQADFERVKREVEGYQRLYYPQLEHSLVFAQEKRPSRAIPKTTVAEQQRDRRHREQGREPPPTRKEEIRKIIQEVLTYATSDPDFNRKLKECGLEAYQRGNTPGVIDRHDGKKYRFSTLGLEPALIAARRQWARAPQREEQERALEMEKLKREVVKPLRFRDDIRQVLTTPATTDPAAMDDERQAELNGLLRHIREKERQTFIKTLNRPP
jgi:hypothetical protein